MLALRPPVLFSAEAQVADTLLNMSRSVFIHDSNVSTSSIPATESATGPAVRKIILEEYIRLNNARKDKEAYENA